MNYRLINFSNDIDVIKNTVVNVDNDTQGQSEKKFWSDLKN